MNLEFFIAKRIHFEKIGKKDVAKPAVKIATGGIATGLAIMILAVAIVIGFKNEVRNKLIGFGSHIQITATVTQNDMVTTPMKMSDANIEALSGLPHTSHVQRFANQPGIIKTEDNFQGIVLKGVDDGYDWDFFERNMVEGKHASISKDSICKETVISKKIADLLNIKVGDKLPIYFIIDGKIRVRPLTICGIYSTGFSDYDKMFIIGDIRHIQRLNGWEEGDCGGMEIKIDDYENLEKAYGDVFSIVGNLYDETSDNTYNVTTIRDSNPQIFSWLDMLDINVIIILALMILVAGFTIISGLLILILEKTNMIGIVKAMGGSDWSIRKIFLYQSMFLVGKGMIIGNIIGLSIIAIQMTTGILKLDPEVYYVDSVPMTLSPTNWLLLNLGVMAASLVMLIGPSYIITKISPSEAIRFE